jgi:hypothetical protein
MDSSVVTALAALLGSLIGGFTSFATTWLSQRQSAKALWLRDEVSKREALYQDFIDESAQRLADAIENSLTDKSQVVRFYALFHRIRLVSTPEVAQSAERVMEVAIKLYNSPNVTLRSIFSPDAEPGEGDPLIDFGTACRGELDKMKRGMI